MTEAYTVTQVYLQYKSYIQCTGFPVAVLTYVQHYSTGCFGPRYLMHRMEKQAPNANVKHFW